MTVTLTPTLPLFVVLLLFVALEAVAQPVPIDLGTLGGTYSNPSDVNDSGQVVGVSTAADGESPWFLWTAANGMVDLRTFGNQCGAAAINEGGQMVGARIIPNPGGGNPTERACSWTAAGGPIDLGTLGGSNSRALAVNDRGQVVGHSQIAGDTAWHPFVWTASEGMVDLDPFSVFPNFFADVRMGINNGGQIFGAAETQSLDEDARPIERSFVWTPTSGIVILPTLGGERNGAHDIDEKGQIVGKSETGERGALGARVYHAYLWTPTGGMVDLGALGGYTSEARAVNEMGVVAGTANTVGSVDWHGSPICSFVTPGDCDRQSIQHAFVWTPTDGMLDLGTLGGVRSAAYAINDHGDVVGWSQTGRMNEGEHAFVWTPTDGMVDLVPLPDYVASWATHVNNRRQIVGYSRDQAGPAQRLHATMWQLPATEWTFCAPENGVCAFTGTIEVRYGANGSFVYQTLTDGTACTNEVFGDPIYGTVKQCAIRSTPPPREWTFCAPEGGVCAFTGTTEVRYGASGSFVYQTLTDGTACTNEVFGDPIYGTVKQCAIRSTPPPTEWTFCAPEGGVCAFTGTTEVRYGASGSFVYQTLTDGTACTNEVFGDPIYGTVKQCAIRSTPPPTEWTFCAPEGGVCAFTGTTEVRYGANDSFFFKTLTDGTACTNEVFGDPILGTLKQCFIRSTTPVEGVDILRIGTRVVARITAKYLPGVLATNGCGAEVQELRDQLYAIARMTLKTYADRTLLSSEKTLADAQESNRATVSIPAGQPREALIRLRNAGTTAIEAV